MDLPHLQVDRRSAVEGTEGSARRKEGGAQEGRQARFRRRHDRTQAGPAPVTARRTRQGRKGQETRRPVKLTDARTRTLTPALSRRTGDGESSSVGWRINRLGTSEKRVWVFPLPSGGRVRVRVV